MPYWTGSRSAFYFLLLVAQHTLVPFAIPHTIFRPVISSYFATISSITISLLYRQATPSFFTACPSPERIYHRRNGPGKGPSFSRLVVPTISHFSRRARIWPRSTPAPAWQPLLQIDAAATTSSFMPRGHRRHVPWPTGRPLDIAAYRRRAKSARGPYLLICRLRSRPLCDIFFHILIMPPRASQTRRRLSVSAEYFHTTIIGQLGAVATRSRPLHTLYIIFYVTRFQVVHTGHYHTPSFRHNLCIDDGNARLKLSRYRFRAYYIRSISLASAASTSSSPTDWCLRNLKAPSFSRHSPN